MRLAAALVAAWFVLLVSGSALAQENKTVAREKFSEASAAHARGEFEKAANLFEEAHRLAPAAGAKFNAGIAWDQAGEQFWPRAADAYETSLEMGGLTEDEAQQARSRLGSLKKLLGYVQVDRPLGAVVSIAHLENAPVPVRVHVKPGRHELVAVIDGRTERTELDVGAGEVRDISLARAAPEPRSTPKPVATPLPLPPSKSEPGRDRPPVDSSAQKTWGFVALGAGAVLAGTAIFLGVKTLDARDRWDDSNHLDLGVRDEAVGLRTWTNIAWGGAAVAGGLGTVLLLTAPSVEF
jgi:hypothetical protein